MKSFALAALAALLLSCGESSARLTQVLLVMQGGANVRLDTDRLEVELRSGPKDDRASWERKKPELFENFTWPASLALIPAGDASSTGFEVVVTAYRGTTRLVVSRVISAFIPGKTLLLEITLADDCINFFSCGEAETCSALTGEPTCETAAVDPDKLPAYDGPDKVRDNTDGSDGGRDGAHDSGTPKPEDAGPCVAAPGGREDCFNGKDDDCNGATDCEDSACTPIAMCVPGEREAGVLIPVDQPCPEGFTADEVTLNRGLAGGGCIGCSCDVTPTSCSAQVFTYPRAGDTDTCADDTYNQLGTAVTVNVFYNDWANQDGQGCPQPLAFEIGGWRTMAITPTDGTCSARGSASPEAARWSETKKFCRPPAVGRGCGAHQVCAPTSAQPRCGVVTSAGDCASGAVEWFEGYTDGRTCGSCRCDNGAGGSCAGVKVQFGSDYSCIVNKGSTGANEKNCGYIYSPPAFLTGTPINKTCIPSASTSGALTPTGSTLLCCAGSDAP